MKSLKNLNKLSTRLHESIYFGVICHYALDKDFFNCIIINTLQMLKFFKPSRLQNAPKKTRTRLRQQTCEKVPFNKKHRKSKILYL